jgi:hypothetical protein
MEEKWIILKSIDFSLNLDVELLDIVEANGIDMPMIFDSLDEASEYQEANAINGQCVQLP